MQTLEKRESQETQEMRLRRLEDIMATVVKNQTQILRIQQEHSTGLANLEELMGRAVEELVSIREILDSSRGMGFAPGLMTASR